MLIYINKLGVLPAHAGLIILRIFISLYLISLNVLERLQSNIKLFLYDKFFIKIYILITESKLLKHSHIKSIFKNFFKEFF